MQRQLIPIFSCLSFLVTYSLALNPIILVPGDGGSQIEARLNKTKTVHYLCSSKSDWFELWLNIEQMLPSIIDCWADNMKLIYNPNTRTTHDNDGVETRVPGFGNTSTVEYLDSSQRSFSVYFAKVVEQLIPLGYKRGFNIHGVPYDFRKAANELGDVLAKMKTLVESTYEKNNRQKVIFICHSMGSPLTLYFLNHQTQAWKDKYVRAFVTMAGVWGGTVRAMKVFSVGDNLGAWIISENSLRVEQRTSPSLMWLFPNERFWKSDEVLVETPTKNYTNQNYQEFFTDLNETNAFQIWKDVKDLNADLKPPGVEVFCLHGRGVPTTKKVVYTKGFPKSSPTLLKGDGDGTVNMRSLLGCLEWDGKQKQKVHHHVFNKVDHLQILRLKEPAVYVKTLVQSIMTQELEESQQRPNIEIIP